MRASAVVISLSMRRSQRLASLDLRASLRSSTWTSRGRPRGPARESPVGGDVAGPGWDDSPAALAPGRPGIALLRVVVLLGALDPIRIMGSLPDLAAQPRLVG